MTKMVKNRISEMIMSILNEHPEGLFQTELHRLILERYDPENRKSPSYGTYQKQIHELWDMGIVDGERPDKKHIRYRLTGKAKILYEDLYSIINNVRQFQIRESGDMEKEWILVKEEKLSDRVRWYRDKHNFLNIRNNVWSIASVWAFISARNPLWVLNKEFFIQVVKDFAEAYYEAKMTINEWLDNDPKAYDELERELNEELIKLLTEEFECSEKSLVEYESE